MSWSVMTLEAMALPAAGPEEARRLLPRAAARLRARLGDDHPVALPQLAADDFGRRAVVEPNATGHRGGLAVAQHPPPSGVIGSARRFRDPPAARAPARPRTLRQEAQRLLGHHQHVVVLGLDDARRRGHTRL